MSRECDERRDGGKVITYDEANNDVVVDAGCSGYPHDYLYTFDSNISTKRMCKKAANES